MKVALLDTAWTQRSLDDLWAVCIPGIGDGGEAEGVVVGLHTRADRAWIDLWPNLRFIATCTTGLDHIDADYARSRGIEIISLRGDPFLRDVWATAEHTMALILALARRIPGAHADVVRGRWDREAWQGVELRGRELFLIGYGRVASQVDKMAQAFGMNVTGCQHPSYVPLLGKRADIVSVHVPLTDETRGMCNSRFFRWLPAGAFFVNTSRGAVVDEDALLAALIRGHLAGAALDVVDGEPNVNPDLLDYARTHGNLILTPHCAGNTRESREKTQLHIAAKIARFVEEREAVGMVGEANRR